MEQKALTKVRNTDTDIQRELQILKQQLAIGRKAQRALKDELKQQSTIVKTLHETMKGILERDNVHDLLRAILKQATLLADTTDGYIYLYNPELDVMQMEIGIGVYFEHRVYKLKKGEGFGGRVWLTGNPMSLPDYATWEKRLPGAEWNNTRAIIGVPLTTSDKQVVGVLVVTTPDPKRRFYKYDVAYLKQFAELASIVLEHVRLTESLQKELRERKLAEQEKHKFSERLRAVIECAQDYIYIKDEKSIYQITSPGMASLFKLPHAKVAGSTDWDLYDAPVAEHCAVTDAQVLNGENIEEELKLIDKEGREHILNIVKVPLRGQGGRIIGICGIARDVTDKRRVEIEIRRTQEKLVLAEKMASFGAMVAGISHEINQPLNSIKILASGIVYLHESNNHLDPGEYMDDIAEISSNADRIGEIIHHIRSMVQEPKLSSARRLRPVILNKAVITAVDLLKAQLDYNSISMRMRLPEKGVVVLGSMTGLQSVIMNVVSNAMEALGKCSCEQKVIDIELGVLGDHAILQIIDNGPGINEDIIASIYEPFFTTKQGEQNMGLGLSISKSTINSFSGELSIRRHDKGGAVVRIELPLYRETGIVLE